ncbi:MAG: F0F1 ATP synthase subunit C [Nitrospirae bacterium]|nr:F0F1 ATP synthase subunit C [Nitrospirota bacterium]
MSSFLGIFFSRGAGNTGLLKRSSGSNQGGISMDAGLIAIGAGLAIGLSALGTAIAQAKIGAAAIGAILEKPESFVSVLILLVIPETLVIFGFTIAILIIYVLK